MERFTAVIMGDRTVDRDRRNICKAMAALGAGGMTGAALSDSHYGIVGLSAPELAIDYWIDRNGEPTGFSMAESRGKWVLLKCFQDWCPGCHSSGFPMLKQFSDRFWDHPKVAIAGIQTVFEGFSTNTLEDVRKNQLRYELPITMGHDAGDPDGDHRPDTMRHYRTGGTPWVILVNPDGVVVHNSYHVNPDALVEYISSQVA